MGNAESNRRDNDWEGYGFAYKMVSLYELAQAISLQEMKDKHGFKSAPRGMVYLPRSIAEAIDWKEQKRVRYILVSYITYTSLTCILFVLWLT